MFKKINKKIDCINDKLQRSNIYEIGYILGSKKEIIKRNLLAGIFRGVGIGIGVTLITAIIIAILQKIIRLNIPVLSEYIVDIIEIVENNKRY